MAYTPAPMRQSPPTRPPSMEQPSEPVQVPPPPPQDSWPCGCPYPGAHHSDCMWSIWEEMKSNYLQTKTLMSQFTTQIDGLQMGGKARVECECPPSCYGRDLGQTMGLQQMQGVTVPWLQLPTNVGAATTTGTPGPVADAGNYSSDRCKLIEEQQRIKRTWAQFLNIVDISTDLANQVSKGRWEAVRRRKERERRERQERREEERRERQKRRQKCTEERSKGKYEERQPDERKDGKNRTKEKPVEKEQKKEEKQETDENSTPATLQRKSSTRQSTTKEEETEMAKEEPEESPQPQPEATDVPEEAAGAEEVVESPQTEGAENVEEAEVEEAPAEQTAE